VEGSQAKGLTRDEVEVAKEEGWAMRTPKEKIGRRFVDPKRRAVSISRCARRSIHLNKTTVPLSQLELESLSQTDVRTYSLLMKPGWK
jgi:hypothetical protein